MILCVFEILFLLFSKYNGDTFLLRQKGLKEIKFKPDAACRVYVSRRRAVEPDVEQFKWISQTKFGKDNDRDNGAVKYSGRHQGEITDDVDQGLVGVVCQLRRAIPRAVINTPGIHQQIIKEVEA
jgi:hypothetical protein